MERKLKTYYTAATQYVFSEACLLDPTTKTSLFDAKSFTDDVVNWKQQYIDATREWFQQNYATKDLGDVGNAMLASTVPAKRRWVDDDDDDFQHRIVDRHEMRTDNEFDRYMQLPLVYNTRPLDHWPKDQHEFPHLAPMVKDVYSMPASSAGVEREFSKSGRVASWTRSRLNPETIGEARMYKSYLAARGIPLHEVEDEMEVSEEMTIQRLTREFARGYNLLE